jgi:hypothetical protein
MGVARKSMAACLICASICVIRCEGLGWKWQNLQVVFTFSPLIDKACSSDPLMSFSIATTAVSSPV